MKIPPKDQRGDMFFGGFRLKPEPDMTKDELMNITVEIMRRIFLDPITKEARVIPKSDPASKRLLTLLLGLGPMVEPEEFKKLPEDIKRHFVFVDREGNTYNYKKAEKWIPDD